MNAGEIIDTFREDVVDVALPYLWSRDEAWRYLNDAYRMFVRLTGGIQDFTSAATEVEIVAGDPIGALDPSILRILSAQKRSDNGGIQLVNYTDLGKTVGTDYGRPYSLSLDSRTGDVHSGVIGMERNKIRWINVPAADDTVDLIIRRLPLNTLVNDTDELTDVDEEHHLALLHWMEYRAYLKQDADTFDKMKSDACKALFEGYCRFVTSEIERYKHKARSVAYGGI